MSLAPTLQTARLTLRALSMADYPAYAAFMASDRSAGMGGPFDAFKTWGAFCHDAGQWVLFGHGGLMIDTKAGVTVGSVGLSAGPLFPETELGWFLYDGFEGQGYATEAAAALRDWAFATLGLATLVSYVGPANLASAAVARRLGAVRDPAARGMDADDLVFRYPGGIA